jgi:hypothetical protein
MSIAQKIERFNTAYRLAWTHISELQRHEQPKIALRLSDSIQRQLKDGATDPVFIAYEALKDVEKPEPVSLR